MATQGYLSASFFCLIRKLVSHSESIGLTSYKLHPHKYDLKYTEISFIYVELSAPVFQ